MSRQKTTFTSEKEQKNEVGLPQMKKSRLLAQIINFKANIA